MLFCLIIFKKKFIESKLRVPSKTGIQLNILEKIMQIGIHFFFRICFIMFFHFKFHFAMFFNYFLNKLSLLHYLFNIIILKIKLIKF